MEPLGRPQAKDRGDVIREALDPGRGCSYSLTLLSHLLAEPAECTVCVNVGLYVRVHHLGPLVHLFSLQSEI